MPSPAPRPTSRRATRLAALALSVLLTPFLVATAAPTTAVSTTVVLSQVYGGGGNAGATYTHDFVELRNDAATPVDLAGWSVQYASAAGTTWLTTPLTGSVPAGGFYLVQQAAGTGGTTPLPTPDATGSTAMSATSGKVALVRTSSPLTCGADCDAGPDVVDFVGYGAANDAETAAAPGLSNTTAALRGSGPDTDDNAADFTAAAPSPRSSGGTTPPDPGVPDLRIRDIQGAGHRSPVAGVRALDVPGVVTVVAGNRFWMSDPEPDADEATSEGILVFTGASPRVSVGDAVRVTGTVTEFRPGATASNLTTTELTDTTLPVTVTGTAPVPEPVLVGPGGRTPPGTVIEDDATGDVEAPGVLFDPAEDGLDFWESLEGMTLRLDDAEVVGPTNRFGELPVVTAGASVRTGRGGIVLREHDPNPERLLLDDTLVPMATADTGDTLPGATEGVLDYSFGNFKLNVLATPAVEDGDLPRETTRTPRRSELAVGTFNVENLDPSDPQETFDALAGQIVENLAAPDLLALEEVQDNTGPTDDGVVAADQTLGRLVEAIAAAGGPTYQWSQIDPLNNADGGQPGGNIRVAFLFRTDRGLRFVDRPGGDADTGTEAVRPRRGGPLELTLSPGRVEPNDPAWADSRKPLAGEFRWRGRPLFVVANHFASKGGDQPLNGRFQPPTRSTEVQRHAQARVVNAFAAGILRLDRRAHVVVLGDINDFEFSVTTDLLVDGGALVDLPRRLPRTERYTYVFEGNSQVLDHILLSPVLAQPWRYDYDVVHTNSEYADQVSDHDPQVVRLR